MAGEYLPRVWLLCPHGDALSYSHSLGFRFAFSRRGQPTIVPLWDPKIHIGQRWNLSSSDISRVLRFYECSADGKGE